MKNFLLIMVLILPGLSFGAGKAGDLRLASPFCDHAVLQRDQPLIVWGSASPGEVVTVVLENEKATAPADSSGKWRVTLPARPASAQPVTLTAQAASGREVAVRDILVGDVWLMGGGGDMETPLKDLKLKAMPDGITGDTLRCFSGPREDSNWAEEFREGDWAVFPGKSWQEFPAAGFYFARAIQKQAGVPIGLVALSGRETSIETWATPGGIADNAALKELAVFLRQWHPDFPEGKARQKAWIEAMRAWSESAESALDRKGEMPAPPPQPGGEGARNSKNSATRFYNGMVAPLVSFSFRGCIWNQGLSNENDDLYLEKMKSLVTGWRKAWGREFPFYYVQAPSTGSVRQTRRFEDAPPRSMMREAQRQLLDLPGTGMVVSVDMGMAGRPIDPQTLGDRLARWALRYDYGVDDLVPSGPLFERAETEGNSVRVHFRFADGGLTTQTDAADSPGRVQWVGLRGADGKWTEEEAVIDGDTLVVAQAGTSDPREIAYAWAARPEGSNLYNKAGLPASPFRAPITKGVSAP